MAKKKSVFTQEEIVEMLRPIAKEVELEIKEQTFLAIRAFYHDYFPHGGYVRSKGMYALFRISNITETPIEDGIQVTFHFSSDDINKPEHHGNVDWVFDADFVHGYHGGPRNIGGVYTWDLTPQMDKSPWDMINEYIDRKY